MPAIVDGPMRRGAATASTFVALLIVRARVPNLLPVVRVKLIFDAPLAARSNAPSARPNEAPGAVVRSSFVDPSVAIASVPDPWLPDVVMSTFDDGSVATVSSRKSVMGI